MILDSSTGKELDEETGLYYYGARYLDPKYSRWLSTDPAMGEYVAQAPINDEGWESNIMGAGVSVEQRNIDGIMKSIPNPSKNKKGILMAGSMSN